MADQSDLKRAELLGFTPLDDDEVMSFSSSAWEPTHAPTPTYQGVSAEPDRPAWLPRDIITVAQPDEEQAVRHVQRVLRVVETGHIDAATRAAILGVQQLFGTRATGVLDAETGRHIDRLAGHYGS